MSNKIKDFVIEWDNKFPVDLWWRKKHNVAFMSKHHRSISFLDQLFEYYEDKAYNEAVEEEMIKQGLIPDNTPNEEKIESLNDEFEQYLKETGLDG